MDSGIEIKHLTQRKKLKIKCVSRNFQASKNSKLEYDLVGLVSILILSSKLLIIKIVIRKF